MTDRLTMTILDEIDVADVRRQARDFAVALGFRSAASYRLATAVSELAHNLHFHAYPGGSIRLSQLAEDDRIGIEIVALDAGPGIPDLGLAMRDGYSTNRGLGAGLPGVLRLADAFAIESEAGTGTRVTATFWRP